MAKYMYNIYVEISLHWKFRTTPHSYLKEGGLTFEVYKVMIGGETGTKLETSSNWSHLHLYCYPALLDRRREHNYLSTLFFVLFLSPKLFNSRILLTYHFTFFETRSVCCTESKVKDECSADSQVRNWRKLAIKSWLSFGCVWSLWVSSVDSFARLW